MCRFTHVYPNGPAPYYTILAPARRGSEVEQWDEIKAAVSEAIVSAGGTITHHHAVGRDHRPWYDLQRPEPFAEALVAAKRAVDPGGDPQPRRADRPGPLREAGPPVGFLAAEPARPAGVEGADLDLTLNDSEEAFRDEVRSWLEANHPGPEPHGDLEAFKFRRDWQRKMHEGGWAGISWPKEFGGRGATLIEQAIFAGEMARADAPAPANILGLVMGGPVIMAHGTDEQKERWLEPILSGEEIWCQGFSEPESGSDLASLKTRAVKENGGWRVDRAEGLDDVRPRVEVVHARRPHRRRGGQAQGPHLLHLRHGAGRASRSARSSRSPARPSSTRSSSRAPTSPTRTSSAARATAGWSRSRR